MTEIIAQASFNSGEWAPSLFARVDLAKYRSGCALASNFFIDYRGGLSTRMGTRYVLQAYKSAYPVRVITFQAGTVVGYVLEFGQNYLRFYYQDSPILESSFAITAATQANPAVLTITGNNYNTGDWIYVTGVVGMTQLNGRYFQVSVSGASVTLADLNGMAINSTGYTAYSSGGTAQRVYTITTPYAASDLALLKFAINVNQMILTHPSYTSMVLTLISATNWTLTAISIGSTALPPTSVSVTTTLSAGSVNYSYGVTSLDSSGQESALSTVASLANYQDIRTVAGSNQISWTASPNGVAYNVYESEVSYFGVVPAGVNYGFIGTCTGTTFIDSNIGPDYSQAPPVAEDPFAGEGIESIVVTAAGTYSGTVPTATLSGGSPVIPATLAVSLGVIGTPGIGATVGAPAIGDILTFSGGLVLTITGVSGGHVTSWVVTSPGSITAGSVPANPLYPLSTTGVGGAEANATWGVLSIAIVDPGAGYSSTPTVAFSSGAAAATATVAAAAPGNPSVPSFCQQRLVLAAPNTAPQTFYMSQPGSYYNFNVSNPIEADDAITETIVSTTQQTIKSIISATSGMVVLTDKAVWLVNGGSSGSAITPTNAVINPQSFVGASDVPPIQANWSILHVAAKGSAVRELAYNIYFNVFTGSDISITSSHLFFGYTIEQWAWAEAPFYVVWAVRSDGTMLTLTFLKEQEFIGWTHQTTQGSFESVTAVTEATTDAGNVDAVYVVVQRTINGNTVQYIERVADRVFPDGLSSAWCVDSGVQYSGSAALSFTGAEHLAAATVTGLATDNLGNVTIIPPFTMPTNGEFTLSAPTPPGATGYAVVTIGLSFTAQLQTLAIDISRLQIQGEVKKIPYVDVRVNNTLGLSIGSSFSTLVPMKDLVLGNISSMLTGQPSQTVTGLVSGDARTFLDPTYTVPGQYCIEQSLPYPASVLGVFPALVTEEASS